MTVLMFHMLCLLQCSPHYHNWGLLFGVLQSLAVDTSVVIPSHPSAPSLPPQCTLPPTPVHPPSHLSPLQSYSPLIPTRSWLAHSAEVTSLQLICQEREPLVLSSSADATVRLWTLKGHYIGTFGQDKAWDLDQPSTFHHPK